MVPLDAGIVLHSTVLDVQTKPITDNLTGPVTTGFLQIRGPLREVHFMNDAIVGGDDKWSDSYDAVEIKVYPDTVLLEEQCDPTVSTTLHLKLLAMNKLTAQNWQNFSIFSRYKRIFLLPILSVDKDESVEMFGLMLACSHSIEGQFQRIGVFRVFDKTGTQNVIYKASMVSSEICGRFDREDQHSIVIV